MKIAPSRVAAFDILSRIEGERAFSSILLPEYEQRLSPIDRGLCHQLTLGILRKQIFLDRVIDHFASGKKMDLPVRISLRLGLYQLLFLDKIPAHSAVNESVNLVQRAKKSSARGFVNAILRRAQREPVTPQYADDVERISVEYSHPPWLVEKWIRRFGKAQTEKLTEANNRPPKIAFRFTARRSDTKISSIRPSEFVPSCFVADSMTAEIAEAASRGEIYFQDEGSQLVGSAVTVSEGGRFIDVCAAPGSKVTQIASRENARVFVAGDLYSHRTRFLRENILSQCVPRTSVVQYDAENELPFEEGSFDTVLVDAPCSGTGTIRHNPEIRYFLRPDDLPALSRKQLAILRNASKLVKRGGTLVYSTCSMEAEENEAVAADFLRDHASFSLSRTRVADRFLAGDGFAVTTPHGDDMDGFFVATFVRGGAEQVCRIRE